MYDERPNVRIYSEKYILKFHSLVQQIDWNTLYNCTNFNECYTFMKTSYNSFSMKILILLSYPVTVTELKIKSGSLVVSGSVVRKKLDLHVYKNG